MKSIGPQSCGCALLSIYGLAKSTKLPWQLNASQTMLFVFLSVGHIATSVQNISVQNLIWTEGHFNSMTQNGTSCCSAPTYLHFLQYQDSLLIFVHSIQITWKICLTPPSPSPSPTKQDKKKKKLPPRAARNTKTVKTISELTLEQLWCWSGMERADQMPDLQSVSQSVCLYSNHRFCCGAGGRASPTLPLYTAILMTFIIKITNIKLHFVNDRNAQSHLESIKSQ